MISDKVKELLGEDLAKQVEAALKGKGKDAKDIDLVVGNDGTHVPADKFTDQGRILRDNPDQAAKMMSQAGIK